MLLRQKAIVEGGLLLVLMTSRYQDLAHHAQDEKSRARAEQLLDLLTPIAKTFPAERGFESNTLAVQVHGGYGYTSEYLPEAWLRDQKLNSLHEGTTGIQSNDLLGRKVIKAQGVTITLLAEEMGAVLARAEGAGVDAADREALRSALETTVALSAHLTELGSKDFELALRHSVHFMDLMSTLVIGWMWMSQATHAQLGLREGRHDVGFLKGKLSASQYWFRTELPRVSQLAALCRSGEPSYAQMQDDWW